MGGVDGRFIGFAFLASIPSCATAEALKVSNTIAVEMRADLLRSAAPGEHLAGHVFSDGSGLLTEIEITPSFGLTSNVVAEAVLERELQVDSFFDDHGIFVQELYAHYRRGSFALLAGKYTVNFGTAWDLTPGVFRKTFSGTYEYTERIGLRGTFSHSDEDIGEHDLALSTFFADTSLFNRSLITERSELHQRDGGPANTANFESFNVALDGRQMPFLRGFEYHVAYNHQESPDGRANDQWGFVTGARYRFSSVGDINTTLAGEVAHLHDDPQLGDCAEIWTSSLEWSRGRWSLQAIYSHQDVQDAAGRVAFDRFIELSVGWQVFGSLRADAGYALLDIEGDHAQAIGLKFFYELEF